MIFLCPFVCSTRAPQTLVCGPLPIAAQTRPHKWWVSTQVRKAPFAQVAGVHTKPFLPPSATAAHGPWSLEGWGPLCYTILYYTIFYVQHIISCHFFAALLLYICVCKPCGQLPTLFINKCWILSLLPMLVAVIAIWNWKMKNSGEPMHT